MSKYFNVKINADEIIKKLNELSGSFADLKPLFRVIRQSLISDIEENFETEGTASGDQWEDLSEDYFQYRIKKMKYSNILTFDGDLRKSFTSKITSDSLEIGTAKEYAAIHNFGMEEKNMPQREFMRFSDEMLQDVLGELEYYYLKNVKYIDKA